MITLTHGKDTTTHEIVAASCRFLVVNVTLLTRDGTKR